MSQLNARVVDQAGNPMPDQLVTLNTAQATDWGKPGITMNPNPRRTGANGEVNFYNGPPLPQPVSVQATCQNGTTDLSTTFDGMHDVTIQVTCIPFKRGSALPAKPTRAQMCGVRNQLQGITISRYMDRVGEHHLFDPEIGWSTDKAFRLEAYAKHLAVKLPNGTPQPDTHVCLSLNMSGLACLPHIKSVIREAITEGGMIGVLLMCMGDGNDTGEPNHDEGALNFSWLMANFDAIVDFMESGTDEDGRIEDLTWWINFGPGFDGVIPAWQPWNRVNQFLQMARARLERLACGGYLNLEFSSGYWSWSGERDDLGTPEGRMIDTPLYEFPIQWGPPSAPPANLLLPDSSDWSPSASNEQRAPWTQVWLMNRWLGDAYVRPSYQPPNYEPHPPAADMTTPRGPKYPNMWERSTYSWTRQLCSMALVDEQTQVIIDLGSKWY